MEFSREEITAIVTLGLVAGFIVSFRNFISFHGTYLSIDYSTGLVAVLLTCFGMIVSVYLHEGGHKYFARKIGYRTNTEAYVPGQLIGIVLSFLTFGFIQFFTPNTPDLEAVPEERMHKHRKYENPKQQAFIAASGLVVTGVWASLLHSAWVITGSDLIHDIMIGNIWIMIYSLIPFELLSLYFLKVQRTIDQIPQSDGLYILHYSLAAYATAAAFALVLGGLLAFTTSAPVLIAVIVAVIAGVYVWIKYVMAGN